MAIPKMPNPNTPEGEIDQARGFASWLSSGTHISRARLSVLAVLGGLSVAGLAIAVGAIQFVSWLSDWLNS